MSWRRIEPGLYDVEPIGDQGYTVRDWVRGVRVPEPPIQRGLSVWAAEPGCYDTHYCSAFRFWDLRLWRFHPIDIAAEAQEAIGS